MESSVIQIVTSLVSKTREKKALWKESSTRGEYRILFEGATVTIGRFFDSYGKTYYVLKILNDEGRVVIKETFLDSDPNSQSLSDLFWAAEEVSLKKNDTLNSIISQLSRDSVGYDDSPDFPF